MKRRILIAVAGIVLVAAVWLLVANGSVSDGPVYQGKTARQWLAGFGSDPGAALGAFEQMGSNAVPFLVGQLERKDSAWDKFYQWLFPKLPLRISTHFSQPQDQHERWLFTTVALERVGTMAQQRMGTRAAIPPLLRLLSQGDTEQQDLALSFLWSQVGPNDTNCLPAIANCLKSTNSVTVIGATDILARLNSGKLAIAPLTNFLASTNSMVRLKCLDRLARIDAANSNKWQQMFTNEPAWEGWQQKVRAGRLPAVLLPGQQ